MDAAEIVFVLVTVAVAYVVKGATGLGGPTIGVPVLAAFMSVEAAVAIIAIPTAMSNAMLVWETRSEAAGLRRFLLPLLATGVVGTIIGVWVLVSIDDEIMSIILGVIIFLYIAWYLLSPKARVEDRTAMRLAWPAGLGGGVLLGSTGIGAPVIATYVHSLRLARAGFVFGVAVPFLVLGLIQIVAIATLGAYDQDRIVAGLAACILVLIVTPVGMWMGRRIPVTAFQYTVLAILGVAAVRLLWAGFS